MKRKLIDTLINWKNSNSKKPILLTGIKGVGKTYLAYDFAKAFFEKVFYLNFKIKGISVELFKYDDTYKTSQWLLNYFSLDKEANPINRILILDEVSLESEVLNSIIQLKKSQIFFHIIIISSISPKNYVNNTFQIITVYPMQFDEFLRAAGNEWYIDVITSHFVSNKKIPDIVHKELLELYHLYLQIGGMPSNINEYLNFFSTINIAEQHNFLISTYYEYFRKKNREDQALRIKQIFDSIAIQLLKDNTIFQYKLIRKGSTYSIYKDAICSLVKNNYIIKCNKITAKQLQDNKYVLLPEKWSKPEDNVDFKLYFPDVGMLYSKIEVIKSNSCDTLVHGDILLKKNKLYKYRYHAMLENYTAQTLRSNGFQIVFWNSVSNQKIDFIIVKNNEILPIEIHCGENTRSKNINILRDQCQCPYGIKISSKNFAYSDKIKYVPYYAVFCI